MAGHKSGVEWCRIANEIEDDKKDEIETLEDLEEKMRNTPKGMFVSGWDDSDDLIEEDQDPKGKILVNCCVPGINH